MRTSNTRRCGLTLGAFSAATALAGPPGERGPATAKPRFVAAPGSPFSVGPMAGKPVIGDMDGDKRPDIVVACGTCCGLKPDPESGHVAVLLNRADKGFLRPDGARLLVGPSVRKLALGDIDGDVDLDALAAEHDTYNVTVLVNDGKGRLSPVAPVKASDGSRPHTHAIAMADLNGDGRPDVLTSNANDNSLSVLLGDGRAGFKTVPGSPFATGRHPYDEIAVARMNRDEYPDVVVPLLAAGKIGVLLGDGAGRLTSPEDLRVRVGERPGYVAVGDFNRDKVPDVAASHDDVGMIDILINDGSGRLKPADGSPVSVPFPAWGIAAMDMDGDGVCDLVLGAGVGSDVLVLLGDGRGRFSTERSIGLKAGDGPGYVAVGDLNGDGRPDIVTSNFNSGDVSVFYAAAP